jgi:predicted transcriptional regulator
METCKVSFAFSKDSLRREAHRERLAAALARRVGGGGGEVTVKQLAGLLGMTPQHVRNMLHARHDPASFVMGRLVEIFGPAFLVEVYGELGQAMWQRRLRRLDAERLRQQAERRAGAAVADLFELLQA